MSILGDAQYSVGLPSCMWGNIMIHMGDIMSTSGFSI